MRGTRRFGEIRLHNYVNHVDYEQNMQMSAIMADLPDGTRYVAFRGTDDTLVGWREDFNLSFMPETAGQRETVEYINLCRFSDRKLRIGGHSKGGNFAVYAAMKADPKVRERILCVYNNDGPGFRDEVMKTEEYRQLLPKLVSILPEDSIVGTLLGSESRRNVIKSSAQRIMQHDALSWQVMGHGFIHAERQSDFSIFMENVMKQWIATLSDKEREFFVTRLFQAFDATGARTLEQISQHGLQSLVEMNKSMLGLGWKEQLAFSEIVFRLIRFGGSSLGDGVVAGIEELKNNINLAIGGEDKNEISV